ncbi:MAG: acyl-CoA thioesterase [Thermodesulfobacteriota bacterium]
MQGKRVSESTVVMAHQMLPQDANPMGNVHGGVIMKHIDTAGGVVAMRHCRGNAVTASIDRLDFLSPCYVGELLFVYASINYVGQTSLEVGVRVEAENITTGEVRHAASAYLTYVALDRAGRPARVPELILENETHERRHREAEERRRIRLGLACGQGEQA